MRVASTLDPMVDAAVMRRSRKPHATAVVAPRPRWTTEAVGFATGVTGLVVVATIGVSAVLAAMVGRYPAGALLGAGLVSTAWVFPLSTRWMAKRRPVEARASQTTRICRRGGGLRSGRLHGGPPVLPPRPVDGPAPAAAGATPEKPRFTTNR